MNKNLNQQSSPEQKKSTTDVVFSELGDYLFDSIVFLNLAYSDLGSGGTTSQTDFGKASRIIDTAEGRLMRPGRVSRMRCQFYLRNSEELQGYILSPAVYDSLTLPSSLTTLRIFRSYVGLKFNKGTVTVVVKEEGEAEKNYPTDFTMTKFSASFTDTFALEIRHFVQYTDIYLNNVKLGSYTSDLVGGVKDVKTFYPFFAPARSTDGALSNIVCENIQFIQNKQL